MTSCLPRGLICCTCIVALINFPTSSKQTTSSFVSPGVRLAGVEKTLCANVVPAMSPIRVSLPLVHGFSYEMNHLNTQYYVSISRCSRARQAVFSHRPTRTERSCSTESIFYAWFWPNDKFSRSIKA